MLTNNKIVLASFIAFAILAMAATTIIAQEVYAKHKHAKFLNLVHERHGSYCGTNYQGNFHLRVGNASMSIPAGMCMPDYSERDNGLTMGPSLLIGQTNMSSQSIPAGICMPDYSKTQSDHCSIISSNLHCRCEISYPESI